VMGPDPKDPTGAKIIALKPEVDLTYGNFLQATLNFLIIAAVIFLAVKAINSLKRKEAEAPAAPAAPTTDQQLLMEIRDILAKK
jgi:large conductance mechanosensitive channel